jgi:hypothetical protein
MFRLRLQYQGANATGMGQFGAQPFGDAAAFGGVAGGGFTSSALHLTICL